MRERPIPFSAPMVRALLTGAKRQTRRALSARSLASLTTAAKAGECYELGATDPIHPNDMACYVQFCPYGQVGDRLWVREAWRAYSAFNTTPPRDITPAAPIWYEAQDEVPFHPTAYGKLRPGMFMPRWASRILLEVTEVRVERLQDISAEDAQAEGITFTDYGRQCGHTGSGWTEVGGCDAPAETHPQRAGWGVEPTSHMQCMHSAPTAFAALWSQINGVDSWAANPWVWAVSFKAITPSAEGAGNG